ncbi:hypothetical protein LAZ67_7002932 [Cordylochernes scorpioides]|uniref:Cleavage and polyadenylation specificity factor subunit 4 n=1 Tax=Cordylochernes scorpioides TaxID=51811 RepID=A0ABY6KNZ0_9ARAC|nr:hypothetical protein LAZ67_7002932 [Cordylochernes scorpioides]
MRRGTTINSNWYCEILKQLRRVIQNKRRGMLTKGVRFHHDNARPHTAHQTTALIEEFGWELVSHPPYSPDVAPSDFHFFPELKKNLGGTQFQDDDEFGRSGFRLSTRPGGRVFDSGFHKTRSIGMEELVAFVNYKFQIENDLENQIGIRPLPFANMDKSGAAICDKFIRNLCERGIFCPFRHVQECVYKHVKNSLCLNYENGFCVDGPKCKYGHVKFNYRDPGFEFKEGIILCYNCHAPGHKMDSCPKIQNQDELSSKKQFYDTLCEL